MSKDSLTARASEIISELASTRGVAKSFCPSEAARKLDAVDWRRHMPVVRAAGVALWREKRLAVLQKGVEVDPTEAKGPIRYSLPR